MAQYRVTTAARMMGVGEDAVRRWIANGLLPVGVDASGRKVVDGDDLARFVRENPGVRPEDPLPGDRSARNRMVGLVTAVVSDLVMAQVEMQCGPHRVVSVMSSEAARELDLRPGALAIAIAKSTDIIVEIPAAGT